MDIQEAKAQLAYVKAVVERSTQFTLISPYSAWSVGLCGLTAGLVSNFWLRGTLAYDTYLAALVWTWSACFILSVGSAVIWTTARARQAGVPIWAHPVKQGLRHFLTLVVVGGTLTAGFARYELYFLIPSAWMLCYGAGLIVSSMFSLKSLRPLGVYFMACGGVAMFWPVANQILLTLSFGIGHLALGAWIHYRFSKTGEKS